MSEFSIIDKFFNNKKHHRNDVLLGVGDDCALLRVPQQYTLATTIDTMVENVHFLPNVDPYDLGYKSLAISLSDLAAMGAKPTWATLAITLPHDNKTWLQNFSKGFFSLIKKFSLELVGGNTTRGSLTITTQLHGFLPKQKALRRDTAKVGDLIFVSGTLGDAGLALQHLLSQTKIMQQDQSYLLHRLNRPEPRVAEGIALLDIAHAAIDISDGLAADLSHILERSNVGATINIEKLPLSPPLLRNASLKNAQKLALNAGDDYELCFTVPQRKLPQLKNISKYFNCGFTLIGKIDKKSGLRIKHNDGKIMHLDSLGYEHRWET